MSEIHLSKRDFRVDWFGGKGAGGQYRNRHRNCCRITHIATGMMETGQSNRDRPDNQREAFKKLARRLIAHYTVKNESPKRSDERIRTYHAERSEVIDHASGLRQSWSYVIGKPCGDDMIAARRKSMAVEG